MSADERTLWERVEAVRLALSTDLFQEGLLRAMVSREADALLLEQQAEIERLTTNEAERVRVFERDGYSMMPRKLREAAQLWQRLTDAAGVEGRDAVWAHPDLLPGAADLDEPAAFIDRVIGGGTSDLDSAIADLERSLREDPQDPEAPVDS